MSHIANAKITSTLLGREDRGIMTCYVFVEADGWSCGAGGYGLDEWDAVAERRVGTALAADFILGILDAVGVEKWEDLPGKYVRVRSEDGLIGGRIDAIGHIIEDKWFSFSECAQAARGLGAKQGAPQEKPLVEREAVICALAREDGFMGATYVQPIEVWANRARYEKLADAAIAAMGAARVPEEVPQAVAVTGLLAYENDPDSGTFPAMQAAWRAMLAAWCKETK